MNYKIKRIEIKIKDEWIDITKDSNDVKLKTFCPLGNKWEIYISGSNGYLEKIDTSDISLFDKKATYSDTVFFRNNDNDFITCRIVGEYIEDENVITRTKDAELYCLTKESEGKWTLGLYTDNYFFRTESKEKELEVMEYIQDELLRSISRKIRQYTQEKIKNDLKERSDIQYSKHIIEKTEKSVEKAMPRLNKACAAIFIELCRVRGIDLYWGFDALSDRTKEWIEQIQGENIPYIDKTNFIIDERVKNIIEGIEASNKKLKKENRKLKKCISKIQGYFEEEDFEDDDDEDFDFEED